MTKCKQWHQIFFGLILVGFSPTSYCEEAVSVSSWTQTYRNASAEDRAKLLAKGCPENRWAWNFLYLHGIDESKLGAPELCEMAVCYSLSTYSQNQKGMLHLTSLLTKLKQMGKSKLYFARIKKLFEIPMSDMAQYRMSIPLRSTLDAQMSANEKQQLGWRFLRNFKIEKKSQLLQEIRSQSKLLEQDVKGLDAFVDKMRVSMSQIHLDKAAALEADKVLNKYYIILSNLLAAELTMKNFDVKSFGGKYSLLGSAFSIKKITGRSVVSAQLEQTLLCRLILKLLKSKSHEDAVTNYKNGNQDLLICWMILEEACAKNALCGQENKIKISGAERFADYKGIFGVYLARIAECNGNLKASSYVIQCVFSHWTALRGALENHQKLFAEIRKGKVDRRVEEVERRKVEKLAANFKKILQVADLDKKSAGKIVKEKNQFNPYFWKYFNDIEQLKVQSKRGLISQDQKVLKAKEQYTSGKLDFVHFFNRMMELEALDDPYMYEVYKKDKVGRDIAESNLSLIKVIGIHGNDSDARHLRSLWISAYERERQAMIVGAINRDMTTLLEIFLENYPRIVHPDLRHLVAYLANGIGREGHLEKMLEYLHSEKADKCLEYWAFAIHRIVRSSQDKLPLIKALGVALNKSSSSGSEEFYLMSILQALDSSKISKIWNLWNKNANRNLIINSVRDDLLEIYSVVPDQKNPVE